ncbi:MAG: hypothetical protein KGH71_05630 [Candidatus Micrarchaeota archaeon]|nr:hypothetical protein [Candidatus Micrarchaeota archaeon]
MAIEKKVTEFAKNLSEIYGTAYDFVRSKHPDVFPPWDQRYVERPESASHVYKKVESSSQNNMATLQAVLRTGDKNPVTKAKEDEQLKKLKGAIDRAKGGSGASKQKIRHPGCNTV